MNNPVDDAALAALKSAEGIKKLNGVDYDIREVDATDFNYVPLVKSEEKRGK